MVQELEQEVRMDALLRRASLPRGRNTGASPYALNASACERHTTVTNVLGFSWVGIPSAYEQWTRAESLFRASDEIFLLDFDDTIVAWPHTTRTATGRRDNFTQSVSHVARQHVSDFYGGYGDADADTLFGHVVRQNRNAADRRLHACVLVLTFARYEVVACVLRTRFGDEFFDRYCAIIDRRVLDSSLPSPVVAFSPDAAETSATPRADNPEVRAILERWHKTSATDPQHRARVKAEAVHALLLRRRAGGRPPPSWLVFADDDPQNYESMRNMLASSASSIGGDTPLLAQWNVVRAELVCGVDRRHQTEVPCRKIPAEVGRREVLPPSSRAFRPSLIDNGGKVRGRGSANKKSSLGNSILGDDTLSGRREFTSSQQLATLLSRLPEPPARPAAAKRQTLIAPRPIRTLRPFILRDEGGRDDENTDPLSVSSSTSSTW